jgi:hypothetical protein
VSGLRAAIEALVEALTDDAWVGHDETVTEDDVAHIASLCAATLDAAGLLAAHPEPAAEATVTLTEAERAELDSAFEEFRRGRFTTSGTVLAAMESILARCLDDVERIIKAEPGKGSGGFYLRKRRVLQILSDARGPAARRVAAPIADHPHTDPGDGRTECQTCGKWVHLVIHSCKGVPVTVAARQRSGTTLTEAEREELRTSGSWPHVGTDLFAAVERILARRVAAPPSEADIAAVLDLHGHVDVNRFGVPQCVCGALCPLTNGSYSPGPWHRAHVAAAIAAAGKAENHG